MEWASAIWTAVRNGKTLKHFNRLFRHADLNAPIAVALARPFHPT
jgi:hypothetical protein